MGLLLCGIGCISLGIHASRKHYQKYEIPMLLSPLVGLAAMIMHLAWSSGFWMHVAQRPFRREAA